MQPSQSPKPVAPIRSADTYSPRHSAVTTETKGVISRCQVGPSQAVIVVPDRVDTAIEGRIVEVWNPCNYDHDRWPELTKETPA